MAFFASISRHLAVKIRNTGSNRNVVLDQPLSQIRLTEAEQSSSNCVNFNHYVNNFNCNKYLGILILILLGLIMSNTLMGKLTKGLVYLSVLIIFYRLGRASFFIKSCHALI